MENSTRRQFIHTSTIVSAGLLLVAAAEPGQPPKLTTSISLRRRRMKIRWEEKSPLRKI